MVERPFAWVQARGRPTEAAGLAGGKLELTGGPGPEVAQGGQQVQALAAPLAAGADPNAGRPIGATLRARRFQRGQRGHQDGGGSVTRP